MLVLLKNARILAPGSPQHNQTADVLIENGVIRSIGKTVNADRVIESPNLCVSPGWFDMQANFCDPGFEHKETIESGAAAAAAGGFTGVLLMPSTQPPLHTKAEVEYVKRKGQPLLVDVHPAGAMSVKLEGKEMAEMYDMHLAGAVAFTDDEHTPSNAGLLVRALLYTKNFDRLIIARSDEHTLSNGGQMNEGPESTRLGLKGIPALAEEISAARNIQLAEYAGAPLHLSSVSTAGTVDIIRAAKAKGLPISCGVNASNLVWDDSALSGFDSNYKVQPPLRSRADIDALLAGLADGTIDVITSDHRPEDVESKVLEFDLAQFGMISLETMFGLLRKAAPQLTLERFIDAVAIRPRQLLGLDIPLIAEGEKANITVFDSEAEWTFEEQHLRSLSRNTPVVGMPLKGKALGICNNGGWVFNG